MKRSAFIAYVSALTLVGGIAPVSAQISGVPEICYPGMAGCRNVRVTVEGNQVTIDPATVTVTGRSASVPIVWYVATPGYTLSGPVEFPTDPVINRFQFTPADSRFCYWWRPGTVYVCHDWNYATVDLNYALKVSAASGSSPLTATGRIVNN